MTHFAHGYSALQGTKTQGARPVSGVHETRMGAVGAADEGSSVVSGERSAAAQDLRTHRGARGAAHLRITPITVKEALKLVRQWHRHLPKLQGGLFAACLQNESGETVGVAIAGNPGREWQGTGRIVISRVAVVEGQPNGCSKLYGALCRAAKALGYSEAWTYTLPEELGTSVAAAGFHYVGMSRGGGYDTPTRARKPAARPERKLRWCRKL